MCIRVSLFLLLHTEKVKIDSGELLLGRSGCCGELRPRYTVSRDMLEVYVRRSDWVETSALRVWSEF